MKKYSTPGVRRSILELEHEYEKGINEDLAKVMTAWAYIKALPPDDPNSFFIIGGFHGEPFAGEGATNPQWWGGYCNHANVLFPTWHRAYLHRLEKALQTTPGCEDVMMPYWDETDTYSTTYGIPHSLTDQYFTFRHTVPDCLKAQHIWCAGKKIENPLASFTFPAAITDTIQGDFSDYSKPEGYKTVRYPLSGLVGSSDFQEQTAEHNSMFTDYNTNVAILNANILQWLNYQVYYVPDANFSPSDKPPVHTTAAGIAKAFADCLDAPNYNAFSNVQSAAHFNEVNAPEKQVVALEQPHNDIHLSVGGFNLPATVNQGGPGSDFSQISDANADMGENDTAGLDPIFYFHHCNIDRVFWLWQQKHGFTDHLEISADPNDPGNFNGYNGGNGQGPANGQTENEMLRMDTALQPFRKANGDFYTSADCVNIEKQLGYQYSEGSLAPQKKRTELVSAAVEPKSSLKLHISGINRAGIKGSFIVAAFATVKNRKYLLGYHSVLSRWKVEGCANCQVHLNVFGSIGLHMYTTEQVKEMDFHVELHGREGRNKARFEKFRALSSTDNKPYKLEIR
ncbi:tyrosinase family protein [Spirosoma spitsbergense]|uniref:tyrosinase family protein n=1 Tax=Spirosoma spitsbergense TaxID=431554 RepID=UPI00037A5959|nr:tyrosinase family protein [Spirosoma spitsbergense]